MARAIGPDISFYQDSNATPNGVNFKKMNEVSDFVIIRTGQNTWLDSDFKENWKTAKKANIPRGSYWFYDSRSEPKKQAELWQKALGEDQGELPLCLDLEENYGGAYKGWRKWYVFLEHLKKIMPKKEIVIYTNYYYWKEYAPEANAHPEALAYFHQYPLWLARYTNASQPGLPAPWKEGEWLFWQYTSHGDGPAYGAESQNIDLNYFNGTSEEFISRFNISPPPSLSTKYKVDLSIHKEADTNSTETGVLVHQEILEKIESNDTKDWIKIKRENGQKGWISTTYLIEEESPIPPPSDKNWGQVLPPSGLNIREGAGMQFPIVGKLQKDQIVKVLSFNNDESWVQILSESNNLSGWSDAGYFSFTEEKPDAPIPDPNKNWGQVLPPTGLNIREGASEEFQIVGKLKQDQIVKILGFNADASWANIFAEDDDMTGWGDADYFNFTKEKPDTPPEEIWYKVTAYALNVRAGASITFDVIGKLRKNDIIEKLEENENGTWYKIRDSKALVGWVSSAYLEESNAPGVEPDPTPDTNLLGRYQIVDSSAKIYKETNTSAEVLGTANQDDILWVSHVTTDGNWQKIKKDNLVGWCKKEQLTRFPPRSALKEKHFNSTVRYIREVYETPRKMMVHVFVIDTKKAEKLHFLVTPPDHKNDAAPICSRSTTDFLSQHGVQIAINGDGYRLANNISGLSCPAGSDLLNPNSYSASRGKVYSKRWHERPIMYINKRDEVTYNKSKGAVYNAVSGDRMLVERGKPLANLDATTLEPRSAVGTNGNGRWMIMIVVDGRQPGYSEGCTLKELANMLIKFGGVYNAINLDGGGSSALVIEKNGAPFLLNSPIENGIGGNQRKVANHLGIKIG